MELALHNWMRAEPVETTIRRMKKYGYDSLEIMCEPDQYNTKEVRKLLEDNGLSCWGALAFMSGERDLLAKDERVREATANYTKQVITFCKELGGKTVCTPPTRVGKVVPEADPETEWKWSVDVYSELNAHAQKEGVCVGIEPLNRFETYFINRCEQALALAKQCGPMCGVCLDAFHLNIEEADPYAAIRLAGSRLVDFHAADNTRMACGMGRWDWPRLVGTLKEAGYDGALAVEFIATVDRTPVNRYPDQLETGGVDISEEQRKFIEEHGSSLLSEKFYSWLVEESAKTLLPLIRG